VLILLPPSETKAPGGDGAALDLESMSFSVLTQARRMVIEDVVALSADPARARAKLFAPRSKDAEIEGNTRLWTAPTVPALERYTGVLYDALDVASMTATQRSRADARVVIASAVFGLVRAGDPIPAYRCSNCARLPTVGTPERYWRSPLPAVVDGWDDFIVDLRSASYASFVAAPGALTARVVTEMPDGRRKVVSHFSKFHKGLLARALAASRAEITDRAGVLRVARTAGLRIEPLGRDAVQIITAPGATGRS
jgi:cytoplasmic iron level regulating protein YaaA (DUF328/UPF0246 family)